MSVDGKRRGPQGGSYFPRSRAGGSYFRSLAGSGIRMNRCRTSLSVISRSCGRSSKLPSAAASVRGSERSRNTAGSQEVTAVASSLASTSEGDEVPKHKTGSPERIC